jgi:hypothetical protein
MVVGMTEPHDIRAVFEEGATIDAALAKAALAARREAQALGRPLVVWLDGRVVEVLPAEPDRRVEPPAVVSPAA